MGNNVKDSAQYFTDLPGAKFRAILGKTLAANDIESLAADVCLPADGAVTRGLTLQSRSLPQQTCPSQPVNQQCF